MVAVSANRLELLQIADAVAREKAIDRNIVITAMEDAIAKAARSYSVHELWQYQEGKSFFTEEQNNVLSRIFPIRSDLDLNKWEKLDSLRSRIIEWVPKRFTDERLQASALNFTNFYHLDDCSVSANFLEAAFVILRSIIQNAVQHGEPDEDRLMVETDAPYLAPEPFRGQRNEPAFVRRTLEVLAAVRGADPDALAVQIAALDAAFEARPDATAAERAGYQQRRAELKAHLEELLSHR